MKLTKHGHACVEIGEGGVLVDPGMFTPNRAELIARATAVLFTHLHFDHVDIDLMEVELAARDDLSVWGPADLTQRWADLYGDRVHPVRAGDTFVANGLEVSVHGREHAAIHRDVPTPENVGYLVEGAVYHPGDAYHVPDAAVSTLLLPTSGPWTKVGEAVDYVREMQPRTLVQIHDVMLSEIGRGSMAMFFSPDMLTPVQLDSLEPGSSAEV